MDPVSVSDYGAVGDGVTDNKSAIEAAIQAAVQSGAGAISFPAGTFRVVFTNTTPNTTNRIAISSNLRIIGAGKAVTTIRFVPMTADDFEWHGLHCHSEYTLEIEGLTLRGPDEGNGRIDLNTSAIYRDGPLFETSYDTVLRLTNVDIDGKMTGAIMGGGGADVEWTGQSGLEMTGCDLTAYIQVISWFCQKIVTGAVYYLHASGCRFHNAGLTPEENPENNGRSYGHLIYVHPNISLDIEDSSFEDATRYGIHWYGSGPGAPANGPEGHPSYARILRCDFGPGANTTYGLDVAILTTDRIGTITQIDGCTFRNRGGAIQARSALIASNCVFSQGGSVLTGLDNFASGEERTATVVIIEDSDIENGNVYQPFSGDNSLETSSVTVRRCNFYGSSRIVNGGIYGTPHMTIHDCVDETNESHWILIYNGIVKVRGCMIRGQHGSGAISFADLVQNLAVEGNNFYGVDGGLGGGAFHTFGESPDVPLDPSVISGWGNRFRTEGLTFVYWDEKNGIPGGIPDFLWNLKWPSSYQRKPRRGWRVLRS